MKTMRSAPFLVCCSCLVCESSEAGKLEGEGVGEPILRGLSRKGDGMDAAEVALKEKSDDVAASAFGWFLRLSGADSKSLDTAVRFGRRTGMRDRAALMLTFNRGARRAGSHAKLAALAERSDADSQEIAAATLATLYCHRYVSDPSLYVSARNDLKTFAPSVDDAEATQKKKPQAKRKAPVKNLPAITEALFSARDTDTADLAIIAAAFSGDVKYRELVRATGGRSARSAGARLLYDARLKASLEDAQVAQLFKAAFASKGARRVLSSRKKTQRPSLFDPLLPGGCLACMGLGELGKPEYLPMLVQALSAEDFRVQVDAVRAIRRVGADGAALATMSKLIVDCPWPVLVELCAAVGEVPDKRLIPALIVRLEKELGRLRLDLVHALSAIAGEQKGQTAAEWKTWWVANQAGFEVDVAASEAYRKTTRVQDVTIPGRGYFYGLPIYSDRLVFVVDTSASMRGDRIASLRENLVDSLDSLDRSKERFGNGRNPVLFNIVDFGGDVVSMYSGALTDDIRDGKKRAETMPMTLGTRSFDAMDRALRMPELDTIYFLSDGAPVWGQLEVWPAIIAAMDVLMLHRPVAMFSVAFAPRGSHKVSMTQLADENFGKYEAPEI